jgi:hypothetical protein
MKTSPHCMAERTPHTSPPVQRVEVEVRLDHPLLMLQRALPWAAITEVMTRHWRAAGKNVDGGPGLPWDCSFSKTACGSPTSTLCSMSQLLKTHAISNPCETGNLFVISHPGRL